MKQKKKDFLKIRNMKKSKKDNGIMIQSPEEIDINEILQKKPCKVFYNGREVKVVSNISNDSNNLNAKISTGFIIIDYKENPCVNITFPNAYTISVIVNIETKEKIEKCLDNSKITD